MQVAAETGDRHLAFMSLSSLNEMMAEIGSRADIGSYDVLAVYDPDDLKNISSKYILVYDKDNEMIKAWISETYPEQAGNDVIIREDM